MQGRKIKKRTKLKKGSCSPLSLFCLFVNEIIIQVYIEIKQKIRLFFLTNTLCISIGYLFTYSEHSIKWGMYV